MEAVISYLVQQKVPETLVSDMREDLENIYMLLFRFVGNGFQLALCNVGWLANQESVVLVPDPIVFVVGAARPWRAS